MNIFWLGFYLTDGTKPVKDIIKIAPQRLVADGETILELEQEGRLKYMKYVQNGYVYTKKIQDVYIYDIYGDTMDTDLWKEFLGKDAQFNQNPSNTVELHVDLYVDGLSGDIHVPTSGELTFEPYIGCSIGRRGTLWRTSNPIQVVINTTYVSDETIVK